MGFDNKYPNRKDWRKPYRKSGRFDRTCRPGGTCPYCRDNRLKKTEELEKELDKEINEYLSERDEELRQKK